jgi:hypothetical protein
MFQVKSLLRLNSSVNKLKIPITHKRTNCTPRDDNIYKIVKDNKHLESKIDLLHQRLDTLEKNRHALVSIENPMWIGMAGFWGYTLGKMSLLSLESIFAIVQAMLK